MTNGVDTDTAKQQPKNPRQLTDLSKLKFLDPIQISIFEWDSGVSESISSKNPYFSSFSKLKSPRNLQVSVLEVAEVSKEENLNILGPFSGDYISTRTVLSDGKSNKVPTLNNKQKLTGNMASSVTTTIKGETLADVDNQNSVEENSNSNTKMDCNSNSAMDSQGKKDSYLRSRKRILRNSNTQTSLKNLSKLQPLGKLSLSFSFDPSHLKNQAICSNSSSVCQKAIGGNSLTPPPLSTMKILSLNCRGLKILEAVEELRCLVREKGPKILFLFEARLDMDGFHRLKKKLDFTTGFVVLKIGRAHV